MKEVNYWVIIPAAGIGSRMQSNTPKQYLLLEGKPILQRTIECFLSIDWVKQIIVALHDQDTYWQQLPCIQLPKIRQVAGGSERQYSVASALEILSSVAAPEDWVLVHDAVRPCVCRTDIEKLCLTMDDESVGAILATPVTDTIKLSTKNQTIEKTLDRNTLWRAVTPQMFRYSVLSEAIKQAIDNGIVYTDECAAVEALGLQPKLVESKPSNIKVTVPEDLVVAEALLRR